MNNSDQPDQLADNECTLIQNGITNAVGYLEKRAGSDIVGNTLYSSESPSLSPSSSESPSASPSSSASPSDSPSSSVSPSVSASPSVSPSSSESPSESPSASPSSSESPSESPSASPSSSESPSVSPSIAPAPQVTGLFTFIADAGVTKELRVHDTNLEYNNSGTWTEIGSDELSNGLDTWFTQANNKVYILNGTDNAMSYDGTTLTDLGNTTYPKGKYAAFWKNYMFICGDGVLNSTTYNSRVWFSNLGDPDTFTTGTDYFDVNKSDGQDITGIASLGEFLVIFKRKSIYIMSGSNPDAWKLSGSVNNLSQIANGIGCVSAKSIVQVGNDLWFMSDDGVRSVRRNEEGSIPLMGLVSGNVNGTIDTINWTYAHRIAGVYFDNKVYMAIPTGTSTTNDTVLVANTRIQLDKPFNPHPWFVYTGWNPYCWNVHLGGSTPELHYGDSNLTLTIQVETGDSDYDSDTLDFDVRGKMIDLQVPEMKKTIRFIKYGVLGSGDYTIDLYSSRDGNNWILQDEINLQQGSLWNSATWGTDTWNYLYETKAKTTLKIGSPQVMFRFHNSGASQPITLYPFTVAIKQRKLK